MSKYLLSEYIPPSRPYSNKELKYMCLSIYDEFNLSDTFATHTKCNHTYRVKKNGKKEKDIKENNNYGSCSVCWKLKNTNPNIKNIACNLISEYIKFLKEKQQISYDTCDMEKMFYGWLYENL